MSEIPSNKALAYTRVIRKAQQNGWELTPVADEQLSIIEQNIGVNGLMESTFLYSLYKHAKQYLQQGKVTA